MEGDRRERENGEKQGGGISREDEKRENMSGKEVGGGGRWRGEGRGTKSFLSVVTP